MTLFPPILDGKDYFHITDEVRPRELISTNKSSIWYHGNKKKGGGANAVNMAVSYNGSQVFLFLYCKFCKKWRMPEEGGHTGSHHVNFCRGDICLPVNHCSWIVYFEICTFYGIPLALDPTNWSETKSANAQIPRMIELPQDNDAGQVDDAPPPAVARARGRNVPLDVGQVDNDLSDDHHRHKVAIRPRRSTAGNVNYDINIPSLNLDDVIGVESPICPRQSKNKKRSRHA